MRWHLSVDTREQIRSLTERTLRDALHFNISKSITQFVLERMAMHQHAFEHELHHSYPIKASGVIATPTIIKKWRRNNDSILHPDLNLAPEDVTPEVKSFPINTVSVVYLFSLLEDYGATLATLIDPASLAQRRSWHSAVHGDANMADTAVQQKLRAEFAACFNCSPVEVSFEILGAFVELKRLRNQIVHERVQTIYLAFSKIVSYVIAIICHLHFLAVPKDTGLRL